MGKHPVAFVIDDNFATPAAVTITSLLTNKDADAEYKLYICSNGLSQKSREFLLSFEDSYPGTLVEIVDVNLEIFESIYVHSDSEIGAGSITALAKFLFQEIIPENRVLYLDADLLVRSDISELFSLSLDDYVAAVVRDSGNMHFRTHILETTPDYFNSGVMLINLEKSRELDMTSKLIEAKKSSREMNLVDQDAFNIAYDGLTLLLPPTYNALLLNLNNAVQKFSMDEYNALEGSHYSCLYDLNDDAKIVHFSSHKKPWEYEDLQYESMRFSDEWLGYYRLSPCRDTELHREKLLPERKSPEEVPVAIAVGDGDMFNACVTAISALENVDPKSICSIYFLVSDGIDDEEAGRIGSLFAKYENCRMTICKMEEFLGTHGIDADFLDDPSSFKLLLPSLLPQYGKIVYLDSNVIVTGDIAGLYSIELEDACMGGVEEPGFRYLEDSHSLYGRYVDFSCGDRPVDTAVLLLDLDEMRGREMEQRCLEEADSGKSPSDALNEACRGHVQRLEYRYNCMLPAYGRDQTVLIQAYSVEEVNEANDRPVAIQFAGSGEPWRNLNCPLADRWWKYARMVPGWDSILHVDANKIDSLVESGKNANFSAPRLVDGIFSGMHISDYTTVVVRLKNIGASTNDISLLASSDPEVKFDDPPWLGDSKNGREYEVRSNAGRLSLKLHCIGDGDLNISLRGANIFDEYRNRVSVWIEYTSAELDGESLLAGPVAASSTRPHAFTRKVADGEDIDLCLSWRIANGPNNFESLSRMLTARIDIKDTGAEDNRVEILGITDPSAYARSPNWFHSKTGEGQVIESAAGKLGLKLRCRGDGNLQIALRGQDARDADGARIPAWIDYTSFIVDGEPVLDGVQAVWHDKPFRWTRNVIDGQVVEVSLAWHSHDETELETESPRNVAELNSAKREIDALHSTASWKIGRAITWLPRKIRDWILGIRRKK